MPTGRSAKRLLRRLRAARPRLHSKLLVLPLLLLAFAALFVIASVRLTPLVSQMALYTVTDTVTRTVNYAVDEKIADGSLDYNELVELEKDSDGNITALVTNMAKINTLQTEITNDAIGRVTETLSTELQIPLGNLVGGPLLSGRGPKIPVRILSVTSSSASFNNQFSAAGINQTRHQIILNMTVSIEVLVPGKELNCDVETDIIIAETIIVGRVPDTYAQLT